jgi:hypothetical protein
MSMQQLGLEEKKIVIFHQYGLDRPDDLCREFRKGDGEK